MADGHGFSSDDQGPDHSGDGTACPPFFGQVASFIVPRRGHIPSTIPVMPSGRQRLDPPAPPRNRSFVSEQAVDPPGQCQMFTHTLPDPATHRKRIARWRAVLLDTAPAGDDEHAPAEDQQGVDDRPRVDLGSWTETGHRRPSESGQ